MKIDARQRGNLSEMPQRLIGQPRSPQRDVLELRQSLEVLDSGVRDDVTVQIESPEIGQVGKLVQASVADVRVDEVECLQLAAFRDAGRTGVVDGRGSKTQRLESRKLQRLR